MAAPERSVETRAGRIAVLESAGAGPAVLLIHGNSCCKEAWRKQYEGPLGERYCMIAMDLPGHGRSEDAADPVAAYNMPAYADTAVEVLRALKVEQAAVIGWSLGGHIGIEMISRFPGMTGLLICGTPPVSKAGEEAIKYGFIMTQVTALMGQVTLTDEEAEAIARGAMGYEVPLELFILEAVKRTDGRARSHMYQAFLGGIGDNQRAIVETSPLPLAVANGADEPFINNDYIADVPFGNLWEGTLHLIPGAGHAPFWSKPEAFNEILTRFLADVT